MNFEEYEQQCGRTFAGGGGISHYALGLCGEAGEVADLIKKELYHGHPADVAKIKSELGDVLWYVAALCRCYGLTLTDVAEQNIAKLEARYPAGFSTAASIARVDVPPSCTRCNGSGIISVTDGPGYKNCSREECPDCA